MGSVGRPPHRPEGKAKDAEHQRPPGRGRAPGPHAEDIARLDAVTGREEGIPPAPGVRKGVPSRLEEARARREAREAGVEEG